jgi:hypothetical protein
MVAIAESTSAVVIPSAFPASLVDIIDEVRKSSTNDWGNGSFTQRGKIA